MRWHPLTIADVRVETERAISVAFDVASDMRPDFAYHAGQFLTLRAAIDGEEVRRSYSLCSPPISGEWRIAVKRVPHGRFSNWFVEHAHVGMTLEVAIPDGRFVYRPASDPERLLLVAAGSGITPVMAIAATALECNPAAQVTLLYGNATVPDIMFREALEDLRDRFLSRFQLIHCLSREMLDAPIARGRIDARKLDLLFSTLVQAATVTHVYACGPGDLADVVLQTAVAAGVPPERVQRELFLAPGQRPAVARSPSQPLAEAAASDGARVRLTADGKTREFCLPANGPSLLDAALAAGFDVPFSCKSGVCCTCRARLRSGTVRMDANWTLTADEIAAGYVLTCQAHPVSATLEVSFDER